MGDAYTGYNGDQKQLLMCMVSTEMHYSKQKLQQKYGMGLARSALTLEWQLQSGMKAPGTSRRGVIPFSECFCYTRDRHSTLVAVIPITELFYFLQEVSFHSGDSPSRPRANFLGPRTIIPLLWLTFQSYDSSSAAFVCCFSTESIEGAFRPHPLFSIVISVIHSNTFL